MMKLKIGSVEKKKGFVHLDVDSKARPDVIADAERMPFPDNTFDYILADSVLEHMDMFLGMKEIHRVSRNGTVVEIWMPHWSSHHAWAHLQHKRGGSYFMFSDTRCKEYGFDFDVLERRILVEGRDYPYNTGKPTRWRPIFMIVEWLANKFPTSFERLWCYWVGGAEGLYFKLKVKK